MDLALLATGLGFFIIGILWGYALFHKPFKFEVHLHKPKPAPLLADDVPKVSIKHESRVDEVIKQAKVHFKTLQQKGNA